MKKKITPNLFGEGIKNPFEIIKLWGDEFYDKIWRLSREAQIISPDEPFKVETLYGYIQFIPKKEKKEIDELFEVK
jgi:hypothetical protein